MSRELLFTIAGAPPVTPVALEGSERLGEPSTFVLELRGAVDAPLEPRAALFQPCRLTFGSAEGSRRVLGVVTRCAVVVSDHEDTVGYRVTMRSALALLELRRLARTFTGKSAPEIIEQVVGAVGVTTRRHLFGAYSPLDFVAQYQETDADFVRRLCEEHGLFFRCEAGPKGEVVVLEDDTRQSDAGATPALAIVSREARTADRAVGFEPRFTHRRRSGKVTLRDYDPAHPDAPLEGSAVAGSEGERDMEHYRAPGGFREASEGGGRAQRWLDQLRADADVLTLSATDFSIVAGQRLDLVEGADYVGLVHPAGAYTVIAVKSRWHAEARAEPDGVEIEAVPRSVAFRLRAGTPAPHIAGVQSAWVAGKSGQEIDPDDLGRVHLAFHWDVHSDHPAHENPRFRVMQPELAEALIVPRVGWEVFVAFEDGDPTRPHVLGRSFNRNQPPPYPLPANKTITSIGTDSSPGRAARTVVQADDRAGGELVLWHAPLHMKTTIKERRRVDTGNNENEKIIGSAFAEIGAGDTLSIDLGWLASVGSRLIEVFGPQEVTVGGNYGTKIGPSFVVVGGLCGEQIGNPVDGLKNLATSTPFAAAGLVPVVGPILALGAGLGRAAYEGYQRGGLDGALGALAKGGAGAALSFLPGGDAAMHVFGGSGWAMPWDHGRLAPGPAEPGGGGVGAAGGDGAAIGPGPGWRITRASELYVELVGGAYGIATGKAAWSTFGPSIVSIRGSHTTRALVAGMMMGGGASEQVGSLRIETKKNLEHTYKGSLTRTVNGPLTVTTQDEYHLTTKEKLTLRVDGDLEIGGSKVTFKVGSAQVTASSSGVLIEAGTIRIKKASQQSGGMTHS
jgi:type VI secretion system secreted protein VgrG